MKTISVVLAAVMICLSLSACCNGNYASAMSSSLISSYTISVSLATSSSTTQTNKFTITSDYVNQGWGVQPNADYLLQINSTDDVDHIIRISLLQDGEGATPSEAADILINNIKNGTTGKATIDDYTLYTETPTESTMGGLPAVYVEYSGTIGAILNKHYHCWFVEVEGSMVLVCEEYPVTIAERDRTASTAILDSIKFISASASNAPAVSSEQ